VVRELVLHRGGYDLVVHRRGGHEVRGRELHRCTCEVRGLVLHLGRNVVSELVHHHDGHDLVVHRRGGHEVRGRELHRCTCEVRGLDDRLRNDRGFRLAFRRLCAVACQKDSKHHCCALRLVLRRAGIQRDYEHLGRAVHVVREIRPLPPWYLAWRASWPL
jgi:hypothetical protein